MKNLKPEPVPKMIVCSLCGQPWNAHGDDPSPLVCIDLLKKELAKRPAMVLTSSPSPVASSWTSWRECVVNAYRKTLTAVVGAVITWAAAVVASPPGPISSGEWLFGAIALATALGVYAVPNDAPARVRRAKKDAGHVDAATVVVMLLIAVAVVCVMGGFDLIPKP